MDKDGIIRGLRARLALDADLGMGYVSHSSLIKQRLFSLSRSGERAVGVVGENQGSGGRVGVEKRRIISAEKPVFREESAAGVGVREVGRGEGTRRFVSSSTTRVYSGHVSLVPFEEAPACPEREGMLSGLRGECMECVGCELCERRSSVVWGEGDLRAGVMFIGEAPGRDEDLEGRPFVGRSGRVLTDIIEKGMGVSRCRVYITNVVKCRPPGNRDPRLEEVGACSRFLRGQIEVIGPRVIVAVGSVAGRTLLGMGEGSSGLRGRWHEYCGIPLRVIYHPSYLLRLRRDERDRTQADRVTWGDIKEVMARLGE